MQLWSGLLRQRCFISLPANMTKPSYVPAYYRLPNSDKEYLCSTMKDNGLHRCQDLPQLRSSDLSTICQNSLPLDYQPPPGLITNGSGDFNWQQPQPKYEERFIEGELVPYDLVPGDESSPFLVKQMSPLIAQSVFQPAYAPRRVDSLPSIRQRREANNFQQQQQGENNNNDSGVNYLGGGSNGTSKHMGSLKPSQHHRRHYNKIGEQKQQQLEKMKSLGERIRLTRLATASQRPKLIQNAQDHGSSDATSFDQMVETNANSDQFESASQTEFTKSDKSSKRYFMRKKANKSSCINWNKYYTECRAGDSNPFQGTISFDNVGMAWTTIFLVISLEGWSDIMYLLQDSHSFWVWVYFVLLIVIGSFFMINLCLVVIATQFSATKKREMERMRQERMKFSSSSTLTANSESTNCYTVIVKSIARSMRHAKIAFINYLKRKKCNRMYKEKLRQRERYAESHQVTGIHHRKLEQTGATSGAKQQRKGGKSSQKETVSMGDEPNSSCAVPKSTRLEATESKSKEVSAASRRSSWKRSLKQSQGAAKATDQVVCELGPTGSKPDSSRGQEQERQSTKQTAGSQRRLIKLGQTSCGPSCKVAKQLKRSGSSAKHRDVGKSSAKALHSSCKHYHECDFEDIEISFCPNFITNNDKLRSFRVKFDHNIKTLVDHRYFQRLILLAILINAISMGIEYHNQPEQLTEAVEISNIVFACLFLVEMILKLMAHGVYDYVIDGFNCFDGCIVIISILELFESSSGSGLSVLRTFRLLRILKLVRFMPALRRQLLIMLRTLDNVAVFFALLVLFIFIFSILGMNLFGCKFCETLPDGTERCDRKNFNSLLWSLVTVFQILTQEDWNVSIQVV